MLPEWPLSIMAETYITESSYAAGYSFTLSVIGVVGLRGVVDVMQP